MSGITGLPEVTSQIQKFWSPMFMDELRQNNMLVNIVDKSYQADAPVMGDRVRISQINAPTGEIRTVGTDADVYDTEALSLSYVDIDINKRISAALEITELSELQSQLGGQQSSIRESLMHAVSTKLNTYLYSLLVPSTSAPDHALTSTDFAASEVSIARKTAAAAKWPTNEPWFLLVDPSYYSDILDDTTLSSSEYGATDAPMVGGQVALKRFGFNVLEDNSLSTDIGYALYKDALHLIMQKMPTFKVSDLHSQGKFGYVVSVDMVLGAKLGIDGDEKCIKWTAS